MDVNTCPAETMILVRPYYGQVCTIIDGLNDRIGFHALMGHVAHR